MREQKQIYKSYSMVDTILGGDNLGRRGVNQEQSGYVMMSGCVVMPKARLTKTQQGQFDRARTEEKKVEERKKVNLVSVMGVQRKRLEQGVLEEFKPMMVTKDREVLLYITSKGRVVGLNRERYNFIKARGFKIYVVEEQGKNIEFQPLLLMVGQDVEGIVLPTRVGTLPAGADDIQKNKDKLKGYIAGI